MARFIQACFVLHNIGLMVDKIDYERLNEEERELLEELREVEEEQEEAPIYNEVSGNAKRDRLRLEYFGD